MVGFKYSQTHKSWLRQACVQVYMYWTSWYYLCMLGRNPFSDLLKLTYLVVTIGVTSRRRIILAWRSYKNKEISCEEQPSIFNWQYASFFFLLASRGWEGRLFHRKFYFCTASMKHALKLFINLDLHHWIFPDRRHIANVTLTRYLLCASH